MQRPESDAKVRIRGARVSSGDELQHDTRVTCAACEAICCRLEVLLLTDTGVPDEYIEKDKWGAMSMARAKNGWCAALDQKSRLCTIYELRPWVCREYQMGGVECVSERNANPDVRL